MRRDLYILEAALKNDLIGDRYYYMSRPDAQNAAKNLLADLALSYRIHPDDTIKSILRDGIEKSAGYVNDDDLYYKSEDIRISIFKDEVYINPLDI